MISDLFAELKNADPRIASVVIDLYDFSSAALENLSTHIRGMREEIKATGKAIKALSIPTATGGLTYAVTRRRDAHSARAAQAIGAKHKYDSKSDRWYVILDSVETDNPIDLLLIAVWPWKENEVDAKASQQVAKMFNSRGEIMKTSDAAT